MQVLGSENTVELACRSLGRLETLEPFDVSETIEKLTRDLKWIQTRKAKLKVQNSPNFSLPQNSSGGTYYPSADAPLMDQQTKAIKEGWKKFPGLF